MPSKIPAVPIPECGSSEGPAELAPEPFMTLADAARRLKLPVFKLRRAVKNGLAPIYRVGNGRILIRLSEVVRGIEQRREHAANGDRHE